MAKLKIPPGWIDDTAKHRGTVITLVGAECFRKAFAANRPAVPQGIEERAHASTARADASERTALHEAAHACVGRLLDLDCGPATIVPDGTGSDGSATVAGHFSIHNALIARGDYQDFQSSVCLKIMVCLSGSEAERIAGFDDADLGGDDHAQVLDLCDRYYISDATVEELKYRTRELLTKNWSKVERVATALLDKKTLTGVEIDALCAAAAA